MGKKNFLLRYHTYMSYQRVQNVGCCKVLLHPKWGAAVYPATIFTNAPSEVIIRMIQKIIDSTNELETHDNVMSEK
jgi:hypothetical protein